MKRTKTRPVKKKPSAPAPAVQAKPATKRAKRRSPRKEKATLAPAVEQQPARVLARTRAEAVKLLDSNHGLTIAVRTLQDWITAKGCPAKTEGGYDVAAIAEWAANNTDAGDGRAHELFVIRLERNRIALEMDRLELREMQILAAEREGNILPRDEVVGWLNECFSVVRARLMSAPKKLAALIDETKLRGKVLTEGERYVRAILEGLAAAFDQGPDLADDRG